MTDLEKMKALYDELEIDFHVHPTTARSPVVSYKTSLTIDGIIGYSGFLAKFYFDQNGKLITYGVEE